MKIVNTLETIREDVALAPPVTFPPSYSATPHRTAGTPVVSPYGHHRYRHGQSLVNGLRSPPEMATDRTSRVSIQSGHESPVTDITSQIHVRYATFSYKLTVRSISIVLHTILLTDVYKYSSGYRTGHGC